VAVFVGSCGPSDRGAPTGVASPASTRAAFHPVPLGRTGISGQHLDSLNSFGVPGSCPTCRPLPKQTPIPIRISQRFVLPGDNGTLKPEPETVRPKASASKVWEQFRETVESCPIEWHIYFGSYSAARPATTNPDGSVTPWYQNVPTWLILAQGSPHSACGGTTFEPYNAETGQGMGYTSTS
jgi:hypothetical protein